MCNYLLHNFFFGKRENLGRSNDAKRSKTGIALGDKKSYAMPTNEDLGQTSNWSKLVAAYLPDLPVSRLTILDHLVAFCFELTPSMDQLNRFFWLYHF